MEIMWQLFTLPSFIFDHNAHKAKDTEEWCSDLSLYRCKPLILTSGWVSHTVMCLNALCINTVVIIKCKCNQLFGSVLTV